MNILPIVVGTLLPAAVATYSIGYEVRAFTLRRVQIPILPAGSTPIKVLHLSDFHMTPRQHKKQEWIASLEELQPDVVVVTGDFLAHKDVVPSVLKSLEGFKEVPGFFVFGSNDYYAPKAKNPLLYLKKDDGTRYEGLELPWQDLKAGLVAWGWKDLTHTKLSTNISGVDFEFRGVDDAHLFRDDYSKIAGRVPTNKVGIGVSHAPYLRILDAMANDGVSLTFAGHTHGGQLCLPFKGALVTNCDLDIARAKGIHKHNQMWLQVSAGLGTNPYTPFRFACKPEATLALLV